MEIENLKLEVFLNAFIRFCKFGKLQQTEETLPDFLKNPCVLKKKKKRKKKFTTSLPHYFLKIC